MLTGGMAKLNRMNLPLRESPPTLSDAVQAPRPDALAPGTRLEGGFAIERVIATSGFSIVYLALDERSQQHVAIKEYLPTSLAMRADDGVEVVLRGIEHGDTFERGRQAFVDEALLLARCEHPSLVKVLRCWQANGSAYRVMPHCAGQSLASLRASLDEPPDEPSLRDLLDGVLGALEVLHGAGVVHGDIVPANILLLPDDHPVLLDGGAARRALVGDRTRALMTLVEPSFAAPEQAEPGGESAVGPWTDLYALAAVMHYCVSGRLPPAGASAVATPHAPLGEVLRRLRDDFPFLHYSRQFSTAIDAALALDPEQRPRSVAEFRVALDTVPPEEEEPLLREASNDSAIGPPSMHGDAQAGVEPVLMHDDERKPSAAPTWHGARNAPRPWAGWALAAGLVLLAGIGGWGVLRSQGANPAPALQRVVTAEAPPLAVSPVAAPPLEPVEAAPPVEAPAPAATAAHSEPVVLRELPEVPTAAIGAVNKRTASHAPTSPREACGERTQFSLYRCLQTQCAKPGLAQHAQCKRLRATDDVG